MIFRFVVVMYFLFKCTCAVCKNTTTQAIQNPEIVGKAKLGDITL